MAKKEDKGLKKTEVASVDKSAPVEKTETNEPRIAIEKDRMERILNSTRLSVGRELLEFFVASIYEYIIKETEAIKHIKEHTTFSKNNKKAYMKRDELDAYLNETIKFMFRMQGAITNIQSDIDGINPEIKEENNESVEDKD